MAYSAPKHLTTEQKSIFRGIVKDMNNLEIIHSADKMQIETASILISRLRQTNDEISHLQSWLDSSNDPKDQLRFAELIDKKAATYNKTAGVLNSTLDKLGLSNTKRNPVRRDRGRPEKSPGSTPEDKDRKAWGRVLKAVK